MDLTLTKIGNSRGIIIPAHLIQEYGFGDKITLEAEKDQLVLKRKKNPREGWEEAFSAAGADDEDWGDWQNMPNDFDSES